MSKRTHRVGGYVTTYLTQLGGTGVITSRIGTSGLRLVKFRRTEITLGDWAFRPATTKEKAAAKAAGVLPR